MQHIRAEFGFEIGLYYQEIHLSHSRTQGTKGRYHGMMATNFGTKIAINAYKCTCMRDNEMRLLITWGFRGRPIQRRNFWLQGFKGHYHGNQILATIGKNHKNRHNISCMRHIHAEFGFEIGFVPSGNSSVILPYTRDKGALPWQPILGLKLL